MYVNYPAPARYINPFAVPSSSESENDPYAVEGSMRDLFGGRTPKLHHLDEDVQKKLRKIEAVGYDNMKWYAGVTILHWACRKRNVGVLRYVLENRLTTDPEPRDSYGRTPLYYAKPKEGDALEEDVCEFGFALELDFKFGLEV